MAIDLTADDLIRNPAWHLYDLDMQRGELHFLEVTPDTYRLSAFLDNRIAYTGDRMHGFPLYAVADALRNAPTDPPPIAFLFHSSFCCSSLLARSLQLEKRTLVLREPWVLRRLADLKRDLAQRRQSWRPQGPQLLDLVLRLLSKTWDPGESVLIKPTHVANNLALDSLTLRPQARGILLHSDLESFLISNLKKNEETRAKTDAMLLLFDQDTGYSHRFPQLSLKDLAYLQKIAVIWHAQMLLFQELLASPAGPQLRSLDSGVLLARRAETLEAAASFLGYALTPGEAAGIVAGPVWNTHAKDPFSAYDSDRRDAENREVAASHTTELRATMRWTEDLLQLAPPELARPLLP